jgi:large subunit ribosomal protein L9
MISVILKKDVDNLGRAGEIVRVKPGYGRNFLIPRGMALLATRGNVAQHEHHRRAIEAELARVAAQHQKLADQLKTTSVSIARKAGKDNKLFGSVSSRDIVEALAMQNIEIDRRAVQLPDPIRETGTCEVVVRFSADIQVSLKVNVVGI